MTLPQEPYDGDGVDPWLPTRLARLDQIVLGERSVYDEWFAKVSRWLVGVRRGVITPYRVDPNGVWKYVPQWLREMTDLVRVTIAPMVGQAYRSIFGGGYSYDQRPYVVNYLAEVQNRLVRTPNEVYDLIVSQLAEGAMQGESVADLSARVALTLDATATERWPNRATVVARTETISAYNAGRSGAFQQVATDLDEPFEQVWLATVDKRTRPSHREADGQRVPVGRQFLVGGALLWRPGDPGGPAKETIQCRCTTLLVRPGEMVDLSNRQFEDI